MTTLVRLAVRLCPDLARHLGADAAPATTAAVAQAFNQTFATEDPVAITTAMAGDPDLEPDIRIKLADLQKRLDSEARTNAAVPPTTPTPPAATSQTRSKPAGDTGPNWLTAAGPMVVTVFVLSAFFALLFIMVLRPMTLFALEQYDSVFQLIYITFGALTAAFTTVVSFWLGSSQGSRSKDAADVAYRSEEANRAQELSKTIQNIATTGREPAAAATTGATGAASGLERARFKSCAAVVREQEGGFVPAAAGGPKNMGVTLAMLGRVKENAVEADLQTLSNDLTDDVYHAEFWNALRCEALPAGVDLVVLDCAVKHGARTAAGVLQESVFVEPDFVVGQITMSAVPNFAPAELISRFGVVRTKKFEGDVDIAALKLRIERVERAALDMATKAAAGGAG